MARLALVTGGTRGIGRGCALALRDAGHRVVATYAANEAAAAAFRDETGIAVFRWDVCDHAACAAGVARVEAEHGPVDILVNNAGISPDRFMHKMAPETWDAVIATNLGSCFYMCRCVVPGMRDRGYGRIVNIASLAATRPTYGEAAYAASKSGMVGFTKVLALENARCGITANCIAPGYIDTDMLAPAPEEWLRERIDHTPVGRLGSIEDIGRCAAFLAADEAGFITGSVVSATGGYDLA